ncbi:MAG: hypothetical protein JW838_14380 [Spirochaetes bacterium]|nr:hypothetical protein [Spirochaetota bacterium]
MLYISLALIFLGIIIFIYSIIVDAGRPHGEQVYPEGSPPRDVPPRMKQDQRAPGMTRRNGGAEGASTSGSMANSPSPGRARQAPPPPREREDPRRTVSSRRVETPRVRREPLAVLYEDSSRVIDYDSGSGIIDPSLEGYKQIRRIGSGKFAVEKGGITFRTGSTLYRFDFHRLRDIKEGSRHLALFLGGSESVRLFIFDSESGAIRAATAAYRDYLRSPA